MKGTNSGVLIGRLTKDSELTFMQSGSAKLDFSVAFTTSKKNGNEWVDEPNYLNGLSLWGKTAENLQNFLKKGVQVALTYHLKVDSWEKDGQKHSVLKPVVDEIELLSRPQQNGGNKSAPATSEGFKEDIPYSTGDDSIPF